MSELFNSFFASVFRILRLEPASQPQNLRAGKLERVNYSEQRLNKLLKLLKFADDTKLVGTICTECEINHLHSDLKQLYDWSVDWQMLFNADARCYTLVIRI